MPEQTKIITTSNVLHYEILVFGLVFNIWTVFEVSIIFSNIKKYTYKFNIICFTTWNVFLDWLFVKKCFDQIYQSIQTKRSVNVMEVHCIIHSCLNITKLLFPIKVRAILVSDHVLNFWESRRDIGSHLVIYFKFQRRPITIHISTTIII